MKTSELSDCFDVFQLKPVTISTRMEVENKEGIGVMIYTGILVDKDDFMIYLGYNEEEVTTAINWEDICTIELFDIDQAMANELNDREPGSGSKN